MKTLNDSIRPTYILKFGISNTGPPTEYSVLDRKRQLPYLCICTMSLASTDALTYICTYGDGGVSISKAPQPHEEAVLSASIRKSFY